MLRANNAPFSLEGGFTMRHLTKRLGGWFSTRGGRPLAQPRLRITSLEDRALPSGSQIWAVGADHGARPRVQVYDTSGAKIADFLPYAQAMSGGVRVAVGD